MNDYESVWYLTIVFNGRVSLTTLVTPHTSVYKRNKDVVDQAIAYLAEITPVDVHCTTIADASENLIDAYSFTSYKNVITATLIKS